MDKHGPASLLQLDISDRLFHQPVNRRVAQLTGDAVIITGHANGDRAQTVLGEVALSTALTGEVEVVIRAHQLHFETSPNGSATVLDCQFEGPAYRLLVETSIGRHWVMHTERCAVNAVGTLAVDGVCAAFSK